MAASKRKRDLKHVFEDIKTKTKEVIQNRKKINHVIGLQCYLEVSLQSSEVPF